MQWNHRFCSICKIEKEDRVLADPAKNPHFQCKLFSLRFTENIRQKTNFCQQHTIVIFCLTHLALRLIIKPFFKRLSPSEW